MLNFVIRRVAAVEEIVALAAKQIVNGILAEEMIVPVIAKEVIAAVSAVDLRILRVVPYAGVPAVRPGQFISLGLGYWEPRVAGADEEQLSKLHLRRLAQRAYSISIGGQSRAQPEDDGKEVREFVEQSQQQWLAPDSLYLIGAIFL